MYNKLRVPLTATGVLLAAFLCNLGPASAEQADVRTLIEQGNAALAQNHLRDAAEAFQKAVDLNTASARAHELLGVTLYREIVDGNVRPSADNDVSERAEAHLKQAIDLAPSTPRPLLERSQLEVALAERSADPADKSDRYTTARDLLKQVIALEPGKPENFLQLASLERDEFGPAIQQAKAKSGANAGPIPDVNLHHSLQEQYGALIEDALANARKGSELNPNSPRALLLVSRILKERALIRDTPEQYSTDMHDAADWQRQFLAVGGHLDSIDANH